MRRLAFVMFVAVGACGSEAQPDGGVNPGTGRYLPMKQGATWTYEIEDPTTGAVEEKVSTVGALEDVGGTKAGTMAFKVTTERLDGMTVSWQEDTGSAIVRHKEQSFDLAGTMTREELYNPFKLRLDEADAHIMQGATWEDTYEELVAGDPVPVMKTETWTVLEVGDEITVPAGTFETIRIRRVSDDVMGSDKTYWFARGVGKVQEVGGQTEKLVSYDIPE